MFGRRLENVPTPCQTYMTIHGKKLTMYANFRESVQSELVMAERLQHPIIPSSSGLLSE